MMMYDTSNDMMEGVLVDESVVDVACDQRSDEGEGR